LMMFAGVIGFIVGQPAVINLTDYQTNSIVNEQIAICEDRLNTDERQVSKDIRLIRSDLKVCEKSKARLAENVRYVAGDFKDMEERFEEMFIDLNDSVFDFNAGIDNYFNDLNQDNQERFEDLNQSIYDTNYSLYKHIMKEC